MKISKNENTRKYVKIREVICRVYARPGPRFRYIKIELGYGRRASYAIGYAKMMIYMKLSWICRIREMICRAYAGYVKTRKNMKIIFV